MIPVQDLDRIARGRLEDADVLLRAGRFDGAIYLCGYAIEIALKSRICKTLGWTGYPDRPNEFRDLQSFRVHKLDVLLHLSGIEEEIKDNHLADWSSVENWDPKSRYNPIGTALSAESHDMVESCRRLLNVV